MADGHGIHVVSSRALDDRQLDVRTASAALRQPVDVRILLPTGYAAHPDRRYPVLYLFHGTSGRPSDWIDAGHAAATTAGRPLIVVIPEAGYDGDGGGWFTDWFNGGKGGRPKWETFHVKQIVPWVDQNLRTVADRDGRAVAGLSQGGFGAASYAARHPDMFVSMASFSGAPDIARALLPTLVAPLVVEYTAIALDHEPEGSMFGDRFTDPVNWEGHNPGNLVTNLRGMRIALWTASGIPGALDTPGHLDLYASAIEQVTHVSTLAFFRELNAAGIPSRLDDYMYGTHTFAYWARDLQEYIGPLMQTFAHPPSPPQSVSYRSIDPDWTQWGWSVALRRSAPREFSALEGATSRGFTMEGTGVATVTTPPRYAPGSLQRLTFSGSAGERVEHLRADRDGRLTMTFALGPAGGSGRARVGIAAEPR